MTSHCGSIPCCAIFTESFTLAAAAILDASTSFGSNTTVKRGKSDVSSMQVTKNKKAKATQRSHTFTRRGEIDSTPKMVSKFDKPYLERYVMFTCTQRKLLFSGMHEYDILAHTSPFGLCGLASRLQRFQCFV